KPVGVDAVGFEGKHTLYGKRGCLACALARCQERPKTSAGSNCNRTTNCPASGEDTLVDLHRSGACARTTRIVNDKCSVTYCRATGIHIRACNRQCATTDLGNRSTQVAKAVIITNHARKESASIVRTYRQIVGAKNDQAVAFERADGRARRSMQGNS